MPILCLGEALIDMICTDKGVPLADGIHFEARTGGAPGNVAAAIAALGADVQLAARVGNDAFGKKLLTALEKMGVATRYVLTDDERFTTMAYVSLKEDGERDFLFSRGADGMLSAADVDAIPLDDISIVHFGSATAFLPGPLQEAYVYLLEKAGRLNKLVSFDPNYRQLLYHDKHPSFIEQSRRFLVACDFAKLSDEEAMLVTATTNITDAAASLQQLTTAVFTITLGKDGALLRVGNTLQTIRATPVKAIDTTGAGDAFVGSVLYQLSGKDKTSFAAMTVQEWETIVATANETAAQTCLHIGAMEAFAALKENRDKKNA